MSSTVVVVPPMRDFSNVRDMTHMRYGSEASSSTSTIVSTHHGAPWACDLEGVVRGDAVALAERHLATDEVLELLDRLALVVVQVDRAMRRLHHVPDDAVVDEQASELPRASRTVASG